MRDDGVMELDSLRFPLGRWERPSNEVTLEQVTPSIDAIAATPAQLREAIAGLNEAQLDTPYREGGWTVRQVVHHLPDSHMNAYIRFRHAATLRLPVVQPYDEALWAELVDARTAPVEISLTLLEALHDRWVRLLRSLDHEGLNRRLLHPEIGELSVGAYVQGYAWHGQHHVRHVVALRQRMGW